MPTRYPGSGSEADGALRRWRARPNGWSIGADQYRGLGQRMLTTSEAELGLLEIREIVLQCNGEAQPTADRPRVPVDDGRNRLQPALLDRLTDDHPDDRKEADSSRVMSKQELRQARAA